MSHGRDNSSKPYGVVAEFETSEELIEAAKAARAAGYKDIDGYSPIPVHGLTDAMEWKDDKLGWVVFIHGVGGFLAGYLLQWWTSQGINVSNTALQVNGLLPYPHNVGGKPLFSIPAFFPPAYELTILFAAFGAVFGMFAFNGLPKPHHPIFNAAAMTRASSDRYVLCVEATDPRYDEDAIETFLHSLKPLSVERVMTSEGY
ncbi:MAG: DUF3341 domain-containing protein [Armatimonadetes bacterium]|nr:DUF3341 domain-containing protein [Armatimonadota bacterium]